MRMLEHHHVTALGQMAENPFRGCRQATANTEWNGEAAVAIGIFGDHDPVAHLQAGRHALAGNVIVGEGEGAEGHNGHQNQCRGLKKLGDDAARPELHMCPPRPVKMGCFAAF